MRLAVRERQPIRRRRLNKGPAPITRSRGAASSAADAALVDTTTEVDGTRSAPPDVVAAFRVLLPPLAPERWYPSPPTSRQLELKVRGAINWGM